MKIEGYEEISQKEYNKLLEDEGATFTDWKTNEVHHFKKAQKFPIEFVGNNHKIKVEENGILIMDIIDEFYIRFNYNESFPLLVKAVEKAKEVAKKNGIN